MSSNSESVSLSVKKLDQQAANEGVRSSASIVTTKEPRTTDLQRTQGVQPSTKLTKPVANDNSAKNFTSDSTTKNQMNTGVQNNSEVKTSAEPRKPVTKAGPINFAKAVTTKMQNTKEEEIENIWESVPKPKSSFPSGDRPKLYAEEEAPERSDLTTNYTNLIPPPRVHVSTQKTEKESWDDDGQYLFVSSKLPTTARECYRWQICAKLLMSAKENRNNSAHPSALEQRNRPDMLRYVPRMDL